MILELTLALSLAYGPGAGYTLDLDARAVLEAPIDLPLPGATNGECGMAYGHVAFVRPCHTLADSPAPGLTIRGHDAAREHLIRHEGGHLRQHSAIGPALFAVTRLAPHAVEDYLPGATWTPRESEVGTCPLLRLEGSGPDRLDRLRVLPCYPQILGIRIPR